MTSEDSPVRVVLDTNILFSALARGMDSPPSKIVELARRGAIEAVVSPFILQELEKALLMKASWEPARLVPLKRQLKSFLTLVRTRSRVDIAGLPAGDNRILECAIDARARGEQSSPCAGFASARVLVTGDAKHLLPLVDFRGVRIMSPARFLEEYFP